MSEYPNIDLRHKGNLTPSRWSPDKFRNKPKIWIETNDIPGWGDPKEFLKGIID